MSEEGGTSHGSHTHSPESPPMKRMRQSSIIDCFRKQTGATAAPPIEKEQQAPVIVAPQNPVLENGVETMSHNGTQLNSENRSAESDCTTDIGEFEAGETETDLTEENDPEAQPRTTQLANEQSSRYEKFPKGKKESDKSGDDEEEIASVSLGTPISQMKRRPECAYQLPELRPSANHTILFDTRSDFLSPPRPWPDKFTDKWDEDHVRMPCSPSSYNPRSETISSRWEFIKTQLSQTLKSSYDLKSCILSYNQKYQSVWDFNGLHEFFKNLESNEVEPIISRVIPRMQRLALRLPELCTTPIPMLNSGKTHSITISQLQTACLLANAFFCTFPRRSSNEKYYYPLPSINFVNLFKTPRHKNNRVFEKLKCLFHYFHRITRQEPHGALTFTRRSMDVFPKWESSGNRLSKCHVSSTGTIEVEGAGMLQVDFANRRVGGGVLNWGCVQEEIRFIISPELILSRLFTFKLEDNECLVITGSEQFCKYEGYADSFEFSGKHIDPTPRDSWGRRFTQIVAIDALCFRKPDVQFMPQYLTREVQKAYCGFYSEEPLELRAAVATGNWGCGVFRGDPRLKSLLQFMAAAEAGRDLVYFTFGNNVLCRDIHSMHSFLTEKRVTVGILWKMLNKYNFSCDLNGKKETGSLYDFIYNLKEQDLVETPSEEKNQPSTSAQAKLTD